MGIRIAAFACALAALPARADSLAVLELRSRLPAAERAEVDATYLTDRIRAAALAADPALRVMTRENVLVLLKSLGKTLEDCEGECEVETGRKLGADLVLSGDLLRYAGRLRVSMRLHETKTGWVRGAAVAKGENAQELENALPAAVAELFKSGALVGEEVKRVPQEPTEEERAAVRGAAGRRGARFAAELRLNVPFTVDPEAEGTLFAGVAGGGVRLGVHALDGWGYRAGLGFDLDFVTRRLRDQIGTFAQTGTIVTLGPSAFLGLLFGDAERWSYGVSYTPTLLVRPRWFGQGFLDQRTLRLAAIELHAERGLSAGGGRMLRAKAFLTVLPPVGLHSAGSGEDSVLHTRLGLALAWH